MIVIADTTPIITLIKLQCLELLEKLFGSVMIPIAFYDELTTNPRFENLSCVEKLRDSDIRIGEQLLNFVVMF